MELKSVSSAQSLFTRSIFVRFHDLQLRFLRTVVDFYINIFSDSELSLNPLRMKIWNNKARAEKSKVALKFILWIPCKFGDIDKG